MSEFNDEVGTIYTVFQEGDDDPWEVWFEDSNIIGIGETEIEALRDADEHTTLLNALVKEAIAKVNATQAASGD